MSRGRTILLSLTIFGLVVFILQTKFWQVAAASLQQKVGRLSSVGYNIGLDTSDTVLSLLDSEQTSGVKQEISALSILTIAKHQLEIENSRLRELVNLPKIKNHQVLGVEIIGRKQDETAMTYIINRGGADGLLPGMPLVSGSILVGEVVRVSEAVSEFALVTSPLASVNAEVVNELSSRGVVNGEFNLALRLKFLPASDNLVSGQGVITSGLDFLIPRGLIIGSITQVEKIEGRFFQEALVVPPFDISKLLFLDVIIR